MLYEIHHRTRFIYSAPAFLEPHTLRLRPRADGGQHPHSFRMEIAPEPAGWTEILEPDGTLASRVWFSGLHRELVITTAASVETSRENPWDYLPDPRAARLPLTYAEELEAVLLSYRQLSSPSEAVARLASEAADAAGRETIPFLSELCDLLYRRVSIFIREDGWPQPPQETLHTREGSCRDLALAYMDAARWMGLAARFVSGYQEGDSDQKERHLHAWAEVYLPGAGWRGYDPTHGLAVADRHVALAAAARPEHAAPVEGSFRGTGVTAAMTAEINITRGGS